MTNIAITAAQREEATRILARRECARRLEDAERFVECDDLWDEIHRDAVDLVAEIFGDKESE
jgi:hypothetical protein